ncbi:Heat shock 70 kDa protein BIP3 [Linum perenne]
MDQAGGEDVVIGIDLGTTFSCVAVARQGNRTTPSFIAFSSEERLIGEAPKNQATLNPRRTFFDVKRLIRKKFDDPEVQNDIKYLPYPVVNIDGKPHVGKPVTSAIVTVPAYFNDSQRQATKDAAKIAGLNVLRIINEPTAGALAYGLKQSTKKRRILVLEIENDVFRVLATGGVTHLGGGDFDHAVMQHFIELSKKEYNKDVSGDSKALGKLRKECERAKRALSCQTQVRIEIDSFFQGIDFSEPFSRAKFEELNYELFKKTIEVVKTVMEDARTKKSEINEIVLVGGSTRIPKVRDMLKEMFDGMEPSKGKELTLMKLWLMVLLSLELNSVANILTLDMVRMCRY